MILSGTQIAKLGERLRSRSLNPGDDKLLADYLLSFGDFAKATYATILDLSSSIAPVLSPFGASLTERSIKSSRSIGDKLARLPESKLNRMQDIVGCRLVVLNIDDQDTVLAHLIKTFPAIDVKDRRKTPVNGYRALHAIIRSDQLRYEVQIRTALQHLWATNVELLIAKYGIEIKYGGGPPEVQSKLLAVSDAIAAYEAASGGDRENYDILRSKLDELERLLEE